MKARAYTLKLNLAQLLRPRAILPSSAAFHVRSRILSALYP